MHLSVLQSMLLAALPVLASCASSDAATSITHSSYGIVHGVVGAALLLLVAIATPVASSLIGGLPASGASKIAATANATVERTPSTHGLISASAISASARPAHSTSTNKPESLSRQASEEELMASEERLLQALGYDEATMDDGDENGGALTEAEIAAFRQKSAAAGGGERTRFKDRVAEPLSEIVTRWQTQQQVDGKEASPGSSPCTKQRTDQQPHSPKGSSPCAHRQPQQRKQRSGGARDMQGRKQRGTRGTQQVAGSPLVVGA